jgi:hypothetical protein
MGIVLPLGAQYAGPAILSRGEAPQGLSLPQIRFQPFASFAATYDTGLATTQTKDVGQVAGDEAFGYSLAWGVSGSHGWRHTVLGVSYSGSINQHAKKTDFGQLNQSLLIGITHQFTRHVSIALSETAGLSSRNYAIGGLSQTVPFDPSTTLIPTTDFFDNRTVYTSSSARITYQRSNRLSFAFSGLAFADIRQSKALNSALGSVATGDVQYRVSKAATFGGVYTYSHYSYSHVFGGTDVHSIGGSYSMRLSRRWEFSGTLGATRFESKFIQSVPTDPIILELLGVRESLQVAHVIGYTPTFSGRLARNMHNGVAYVSAARSMTPGNGLFLSSVSTTVMGGYSYTGFRRWSMNAQFGYVDSRAHGTIAGNYGNTTGVVSVSRQLGRFLHFAAYYNVREYSSDQYSNYNRLVNTATVSLGYAPGNVRLPTR